VRAKRSGRRRCAAPPKTAEVWQTYLVFPLLQPFRLAARNGEVKGGARAVFHQQDIRRCVACHVRVDNSNLGGHARKSALAGDLWCLQCC